MSNVTSILKPSPHAKLLFGLRENAAALGTAAQADDLTEAFPEAGINILRRTECLKAVLPPSKRGVGLGWWSASTDLLFDLLRAIGGVHLSCARLFEGHVNAFQLLWGFGTPAQRDRVCEYVEQGGLLGVWNAPAPEGDLLLTDFAGAMRLKGKKSYASGAGGIQRPLVTARHPTLGLVIVWPNGAYCMGPGSEWEMHGMRATMTRSVSFDCLVGSEEVFGKSDDYHGQPQFSGGSWRFLAAQLGAGEALVEMMRVELIKRDRTEDSHQRSRMARCVTALETSRKWVRDTAEVMVDPGMTSERVIQHANGARIVVERSLLDIIEMVQRSVGLQLYSRQHPCERIIRDLSTYLRQPAPDALLEKLGEHGFAMAQQGLAGGLYDEES